MHCKKIKYLKKLDALKLILSLKTLIKNVKKIGNETDSK